MTRSHNLLIDVHGLGVGHAEARAETQAETQESGVTAIFCEEPMIAAVCCCGGAPATRETDLLCQDGLVERIDAVLFCGGSAFGLAAADGALRALAKHKRGFPTTTRQVPIVPTAALFDFYEEGKSDADYAALGAQAIEQACSRVGQPFPLGNCGAGRGARAGAFKGGIGSASAKVSPLLDKDGARDTTFTVGALAVVNAFGSAAYADLSALRAWWLERDSELGNLAPNENTPRAERQANFVRTKPSPMLANKEAPQDTPRHHTTLCLVAFDCALPKSALRRIAYACQSALAIALHPSLTLFDGDIVFAVSSARSQPPLSPALLAACERQACETLARAIAKGVWCAESTPYAQSFRDARAARQKTSS